MVRNRSKEKVCLVCWSITGGGGFQGKNHTSGIKLDEDLLNQFRKEKKDKECDLFGKILNKLITLEEGDGRVTNGSGVSVCSNCKTLVSSAIESKCKTLEVGDRVEKLQQSILEELKELQLYLDVFYLQMKKIENVMGKNDVEDLAGLIPGGSSGGGLKDELLHFRDSLAKVMTDFRFYRDNVKKPTVAQEQKTSISPSSSTNLNDASTTAASQNGPGLYLLTLAPLNGTASILNNKNDDNSNERKTSSPSTVIELSSDDDMSDMCISPSSTLTQSEQPQKMEASKPMQVNKDSSDAAIDNKSKTDSNQPNKRKLSEDVDKDNSESDSEDSAGKKEKERKPKKSKVIRKETKVSPTSSTTSEDPTTIESGIGAQTGIPNEEKTLKEISSSESGKTAPVLRNGEKSISPAHQQNLPEAPDVQFGTSNGDVTKSQQNDENYSCGVCHVQHQSEKEHMQHMEQHWTDDSQSDSELGQEKELQLMLTPTPASHKNFEDIESKQQTPSKAIDKRFKSVEDVDTVIEDLIGSQKYPPSVTDSTTCISEGVEGMKRTQEKEQNKDIAEEEIPTVPGGESVTTVACTSTSSASPVISNGSGNSKNNDNREATSDSPQSVEKIPDITNVYLSPNLDF